MPREDLLRLLEALDDDTRSRWEAYLAEIDAEVQEKGPQAARDFCRTGLRPLVPLSPDGRRYAAGLVFGAAVRPRSHWPSPTETS